MSRARSRIPGPTTFFSTRNMRESHRDALRSFGAVMGMNLDEALDYCLEHGLARLREEAGKVQKRRRA